MELSEFITARLDEDELAARAAMPNEGEIGAWDEFGEFAERRGNVAVDLAYRHDPARVLAQVEAMRQIVAEIVPGIVETSEQAGLMPGGLDRDLLLILATIWREHPDFDPAWVV